MAPKWMWLLFCGSLLGCASSVLSSGCKIAIWYSGSADTDWSIRMFIKCSFWILLFCSLSAVHANHVSLLLPSALGYHTMRTKRGWTLANPCCNCLTTVYPSLVAFQPMLNLPAVVPSDRSDCVFLCNIRQVWSCLFVHYHRSYHVIPFTSGSIWLRLINSSNLTRPWLKQASLGWKRATTLANLYLRLSICICS